MAIITDELGVDILDEAGATVLDESGVSPFPAKTPTTWTPQPIGYGYITTIASVDVTDQHGALVIDQHGNPVISGTQSVQINRIPTTWFETGA